MKTPPRGGWPTGLMGMLALVLVVERYVGRHEEKFTTVIVSAWTWSGKRVPRAARCEVVGLGDSLVKHGVAPPVLSRRLGRTVYNLAMPKGQPAGQYFLLRRLLRSGARPAALLVDGELLPDDPRDSARAWPELASVAECAELAWEAKDARFFARAVLARALPSFKARSEVRLSILSALDGKVPAETQALSVVWRNWNKNGGAQLLPPPDPAAEDPRMGQIAATNYRPSEWSCHPLNAAYMTRLLDLAAAHDVPVFWLLPPYHPEIQARRERYGSDGKFLAFLRGLQAAHPRLTVIDGHHAGYPAEVLADMTHLNRHGAVAFSDAVGVVLRDFLNPAGPSRPARWVELPHYRPGAGRDQADAAGAEDIEQSIAALRLQANRGVHPGSPKR